MKVGKCYVVLIVTSISTQIPPKEASIITYVCLMLGNKWNVTKRATFDDTGIVRLVWPDC